MRNKCISSEALSEIIREHGMLLNTGRKIHTVEDVLTLEKAKEIFHPVAVDELIKTARRCEVFEFSYSAAMPSIICVDHSGLRKLAIRHNQIILCLEAEKRGELDVWGDPYEAPEGFQVEER